MPHSLEQVRFAKSRDGSRIAYAVCGQGPPLIWVQHWIHHLRFDWDCPIWRPWLEFLSRHHTLVRYDWRGCGLSDRDEVTFSFEKMTEDLQAVIDAAGFERFVLFAMGGAGSGVAMSCAVGQPKRVSQLILQGPHTRGRFVGSPTTDLAKEGEARLQIYELGWRKDTPAYCRFFAALHIPDASPAQTQAYDELLRKTTSPVNAVGLLRTFWSIDLRHIVPKVSCPTLVLHARDDSVISCDEGRKVATLIPGARFVAFDGRNHVLLDSEPGWRQCVEAISDFLPVASSTSAEVWLDTLTAREQEVLEVLAQGHDNSEIAARLKISGKTARNHVSTIFSKLNVRNRAQAVVLSRDAGFGRKIRAP
jgi:pimeloyl-ACP methyl ester carboxylesterase/DNA-binding CsgD family transcriptional regulator